MSFRSHHHFVIPLAGRASLLLLFVLALPLITGAWKEVTGRTINPRYVERIKNGQTTKHEILVMFGDPQEIDRTPEGVVFIYKNYKAAEVRSRPKKPKLPDTDISKDPYLLDQSLRGVGSQKSSQKPPTKVLSSTLTIRFKPDGETVQSHEYKEF